MCPFILSTSPVREDLKEGWPPDDRRELRGMDGSWMERIQYQGHYAQIPKRQFPYSNCLSRSVGGLDSFTTRFISVECEMSSEQNEKRYSTTDTGQCTGECRSATRPAPPQFQVPLDQRTASLESSAHSRWKSSSSGVERVVSFEFLQSPLHFKRWASSCLGFEPIRPSNTSGNSSSARQIQEHGDPPKAACRCQLNSNNIRLKLGVLPRRILEVNYHRVQPNLVHTFDAFDNWGLIEDIGHREDVKKCAP